MATNQTPTITQECSAEPDAYSSRRSFLQGAAVSGLALAGAGLLAEPPAQAQQAGGTSPDTVKQIFTVARTAEQLAVTFYTNGVANADKLGITGNQLDALKAALIEEQIHQQLFVAQGGDSLADTFSFPDGPSTFTDLGKFIKAQQQLEGVFDSAFLAAVKEFAEPPISRPDLAQIAAQIAMIESEHRALGRDIGGLDPADKGVRARPARLRRRSACIGHAGRLPEPNRRQQLHVSARELRRPQPQRRVCKDHGADAVGHAVTRSRALGGKVVRPCHPGPPHSPS